MAHIAGDQLWFADRPGNRRADSFRNIIAQPRIAAALLIPGSPRVAILRGTAMLTDDATARASFEVQGKVPLLATRVDDVEIRSEEHTSELQSLMRISYAVFCLKKKNKHTQTHTPSKIKTKTPLNSKRTKRHTKT